MKNLLFVLLFFGSILSANAQFLNWGVKGGINYNANGDLNVVAEEIISEPLSSDQELGYHFGLLAEIKLPLFLYIRPELLYTHTESSYSIDDEEEARLKMDRIDIPVLLGFRVFKIGRFFFGPSFQYIMNSDLSAENVDNIKNISYDDFNIAAQVGIGLNFGRFGTDIRWEAGLLDTQALYEVDDIDFDDVANVGVDTDNMQFLLSVYWKFGQGNK
jgi:hypothetical protein